jgi:uncharacterized protein YegL
MVISLARIVTDMVVTFILQNGRKVEISDLEQNATWIDAAMILFESELIGEEELIIIEENPKSSNRTSSGDDVYNFGNQQFSNSIGEAQTTSPLKKKLGSNNQNISKPRSGLKKKSSPSKEQRNTSAPSSAAPKALKKKQSQPKPLTKKQSQPAPMNKNQPMPAPPKPRRDIKHYELDINCSKNGKKWTAKLEGLTPPSRGSSQPQPKANVSEKRTIYLCLDDSWSMDGEPMKQLKSAVISFLNDRPSTETIHVLSFNNTTSYTGSPSGAAGVINRMYPTNGTPMSRCLDKISGSKTSSKQGEDVVILFSDGAPDNASNTTASASRVKRVAKLITIGCGSSVNQSYMASLASTTSDYHHASNPGQILAIFQQVARSLAQIPVVSGANKSGNASRAKQIGVVSNNSGSATSRYQTSNKLKADEGFDIIENFNCDGCGSNGRAMCVCGIPLCQGGLRDMGKGNLPKMTCPVCNIEFEMQLVETLHASTRNKGGKKK